MTEYPSDAAFTPSVKKAQEQRGSREAYAKIENGRGWQTVVTPELRAFIEARDFFYLATASADGQPYVQHRGGPKGFLKVVDETTLAFADLAGNAQYISLGNLDENDKALIYFMDYPQRRRIKIWGRARYVEDDPKLLAEVALRSYFGRPERVIVFDVTAWDMNCQQHIKPRYSESDLAPVIAKYQERIAELEAEIKSLRDQLRGSGS